MLKNSDCSDKSLETNLHFTYFFYLFYCKCWSQDKLTWGPTCHWSDWFLFGFCSVVMNLLLKRSYRVHSLLWMKIISWWKHRIRNLLVYLFLCLKNSDLKQTISSNVNSRSFRSLRRINVFFPPLQENLFKAKVKSVLELERIKYKSGE